MHPLPVFSILPIGLRVDKALGVKPGKNAYCPMSYILLPVMPFRISTIIKCSTELVDNVFIHNDITLHLIF